MKVMASQGFNYLRQSAKEPDVPDKYKVKGLSNNYRNMNMTIMVKVEDNDSKIAWSVLYLIKKNEASKKYLGQNVKIVGMGPIWT